MSQAYSDISLTSCGVDSSHWMTYFTNYYGEVFCLISFHSHCDYATTPVPTVWDFVCMKNYIYTDIVNELLFVIAMIRITGNVYI